MKLRSNSSRRAETISRWLLVVPVGVVGWFAVDGLLPIVANLFIFVVNIGQPDSTLTIVGTRTELYFDYVTIFLSLAAAAALAGEVVPGNRLLGAYLGGIILYSYRLFSLYLYAIGEWESVLYTLAEYQVGTIAATAGFLLGLTVAWKRDRCRPRHSRFEELMDDLDRAGSRTGRSTKG